LVKVKVAQANFSRAGLTSAHRLDQRFSFTAKFSSDHDLADIFFVLAFNTDSLEGKYYAQGITPAELRQGKAISIEARLPADGTIDKYELHVFSRGVEVFNSEMPREAMEGALGRMVAKRTNGVRSAAPKPLAGPMPRYPETMLKTKATGRALVSCVIAIDGRLTEVEIKNATDPAFAVAALAVIPQWWFVPRIENGQPVATKAELPFDFTPPKS
jgi:TonB family protein